MVTRRNIGALEYLKEKGVKVSNDNIKAVAESHIIILALKPYDILSILQELTGVLVSDRHMSFLWLREFL